MTASDRDPHPLGRTPHPPDRASRSRRLIAAIGLTLAIAAGLGIHFLLPDTTETDIAADALYAIAAYLFVVLLAPRWPALVVGIVAAGWCVAVELFQLTGIPLAAGAAFTPAMLVLGTVFEPRDLAVYLVTVTVVALADAVLRRSR